MKRLIALAPLVFLAGCTSNSLPQYFNLGELRVVALEADHPEVDPGATLTLTPLLSDLNGAGRALTYSAVACADPGLSLGALPTCDGRPDRVVIVENAAVTGITAPEYTGAAPAVPVTVPAALLQSRGPVERFNGVFYLVFYTVTPASGTPVTAVKRIVVSSKAAKNANPGFTGASPILADGAPLTTLPKAGVTLSVGVDPSAFEPYTLQFPDGTAQSTTETVSVSWFISDGDIDKQKTAAAETNAWTPPPTAPVSRKVTIIAVLRDGRGGEAHAVAQF